MDLGISGKTALVLGASGGLGSAIAQSLAKEGVRVAVAGRTPDSLARTVAAISENGGEAWATRPWDLANLDLIDERIAEIETRWQSIDILVNNTGGPPPGSVRGVSAHDWNVHFTAMVVSVIAVTDRVTAAMTDNGWGRVITSASSGVLAPIPNLGISNTLRSSLLGWSKTIAAELAPFGITANVVIPGRIDTERVRFLDSAKASREGRSAADVRAESIASIPLARYGRPAEYGDAVAFLASEQAAYITGSVLRVDGGYVSSI